MKKYLYILIGILCIFLMIGCKRQSKLISIEIKGPDYLLVGEQFELKIAPNPISEKNKQVEWESYNKNIISIDDNGVVTALKAGTSVIVATSKIDATLEDIIVIEVLEYKYINDPDQVKMPTEVKNGIDQFLGIENSDILFYGQYNEIYFFSKNYENEYISQQYNLFNYKFKYQNKNEIIYCYHNGSCYDLIDFFEIFGLSQKAIEYLYTNFTLLRKDTRQLTLSFLNLNEENVDTDENIELVTYLKKMSFGVENKESYIMAVSHSKVLNLIAPFFEKIGNYEFKYNDGNKLYLFVNNEKSFEEGLTEYKYLVYSLSDAYAMKFISEEQLKEIYTEYNLKVELSERYNKLKGN